MNKSALAAMPEYFGRYINLPADMEVIDVLEQYGDNLLLQEHNQLLLLGDRVYAPGKWAAKDIVQHITDSERVLAYRAMRIARGDKTPLPGFEENDYATAAKATNREMNDLLNEFAQVRSATISLFRSFDAQMLLREGTCAGKNISVLALGFVIAGHTIHHVQKLKELYYPLL